MDCLRSIHNFVFVGETGSGKTELSVNWAIHLAKIQDKPVRFFDMDQTKGLFRARDMAQELEQTGVDVCDTISFMDSPVVPPGVTGALHESNSVCVFDVGGNAIGAKMMGQYADYLSGDETQICYVINPYRPFSADIHEVETSMEYILKAGRISQERVNIISNPCVGTETTVAAVLQAHQWLSVNLKKIGKSACALAVEASLADAVREAVSCPVIPIHLFVEKLYKS